MKLKSFNKLYRRTIAVVFVMFALTFVLFIFIIFLLARTNLFGEEIISENTGLIVVACIVSLLLLAQVITIFWGRRINRPVEIISNAVNRVAQGDFNVKIDSSKFKNEMKDLANDLNKMITELNSIEVMRSDFVSNVSHEFRAPLSAIQGYVTLLSNSELTDEQRNEYFSRLSESTRQLTGLVDNVLKLSRLESQNIISETKVFSLDEQLRQAVIMFEQQWSQKNIWLNLELPECEYNGNEEMLNQMWLNLIGNAIKFTDENGEIGVSLDDSSKDCVEVTISDNGVGMTDEVKKHIFEKFYQADTSRKAEGNGLGLALVKTVADLTNATITVESELGRGSKFTVKLPK